MTIITAMAFDKTGTNWSSQLFFFYYCSAIGLTSHQLALVLSDKFRSFNSVCWQKKISIFHLLRSNILRYQILLLMRIFLLSIFFVYLSGCRNQKSNLVRHEKSILTSSVIKEDSLLTVKSTWLEKEFKENDIIRFEKIGQKGDSLIINTTKNRYIIASFGVELIFKKDSSEYKCLSSKISWIY